MTSSAHDAATLTRQSVLLTPEGVTPAPTRKPPTYKGGKHWTQRPENRLKVQRMNRKSAKKRLTPKPKGKPHGSTRPRTLTPPHPPEVEALLALPHITYLCGRTEAHLEAYARVHGVSFTTLADGLARFLHATAHGQGMGIADRLSAMRRTPPK